MNLKPKMNFDEFCQRLKDDGVYQAENGHLYLGSRIVSRQCRNGYYMVRKRYDGHDYHFMEHRVVWWLENGSIDEKLQVNHKDFDRTNNRIENLELMTAKDNARYTIDAGRAKYCKGVESGKARFTENEVKAIRYLAKNGWMIKEISRLFPDVKYPNTVGRVVSGARYGTVLDASDIFAVYPMIVELTSRKDLPKEERIKNAIMGLCGEVGELTDLCKKEWYQGHPSDEIGKMLELGDILYYATWLCLELGMDFSEIMFANMEKLQARYPNGFSETKSLNRAEGDI